MQLLLINPNTTAAITDLVQREARRIASRDTTLVAATGRFGARYIASRAAYAVAGHAALDAYAEHGATADGIVLACFGDPALFALKEIAPQPVVGMAEASCLAAVETPGRFSIVTGGERWGPMLREFVALLGLSDRLASIETVAPTGAEIAREPRRAFDTLAEACRRTIEQHGATSVILGGAGLAGIADHIATRVPVPVIDSLAASVRLCERQMRARTGAEQEQPGGASRPALTEFVGLSASLTALLASG